MLRRTIFFALTVLLTAPVCAQTVRPQAGEGIWGLLRRNGVEPNNKIVAAFQEVNAEILRGQSGLQVGKAYKLPELEGAAASPGNAAVASEPVATPEPERQLRGTFLIFGDEHAKVYRTSHRLDGHVYYIVSGHGGRDPGTVGSYRGRDLPEDELAYDTALRLARRLLEEGAKVYVVVRDPNDGIRNAEYLPPDRDEYFYGNVRMSSDYKRRLRQRRDVINNLYEKNKRTARSQSVISLHVDGYGSRVQPQVDVAFYYASDRGRDLGRTLREQIREQYALNQPGRAYQGRVVRRDYFILEETKPTAVLVELGNIRHQGDLVRLLKPSNRQYIAEWITQGVLEDVGSNRSRARSVE